MKILLITEFFPKEQKPVMLGGVQARSYFIYKYLKKKHRVKIINLTSSNIEASSSSILSRFISGLKIVYSNPSPKPDIIEASNVTTYIPALLLAKRLNVPAVAWIPDILGKQWWNNFPILVAISGFISEKITTKLCWNRIIAMSKTTKEKLIKEGVEEKNISVIYGGVNYAALSDMRVKKYKQPTICTISRLVSYKRIQDLIMAIPLISKEIPDIRCKIIGEGPEKNILEKMISRLKLDSSVEFVGNISHDQTLQILKHSHIFCLPSIIEGFGIVTVEAMAAGIPYVNSKIPATDEITKHGKGGLLFDPGNHKDLADKIIKLLSDEKLYKKKINQAQRLAIEYDWNKIGRQTERLFMGVINDK